MDCMFVLRFLSEGERIYPAGRKYPSCGIIIPATGEYFILARQRASSCDGFIRLRRRRNLLSTTESAPVTKLEASLMR